MQPAITRPERGLAQARRNEQVRVNPPDASTVQAMGGNGATTPLGALVSGTVITGATAGNLQLQWAQNTSNATAASVLAGSALTAWRFA